MARRRRLGDPETISIQPHPINCVEHPPEGELFSPRRERPYKDWAAVWMCREGGCELIRTGDARFQIREELMSEPSWSRPPVEKLCAPILAPQFAVAHWVCA
jgi:hypothetical protein